MMLESRKIMGLPQLPVSATCVRVPVVRAHSAAINAEFERPVSVEEAREAVAAFSGRRSSSTIPSRRSTRRRSISAATMKCGVGRIRVDTALPNGLAFWVSGDNLWKGAALNAVQIAELMIREGMLRPRAALAAV